MTEEQKAKQIIERHSEIIFPMISQMPKNITMNNSFGEVREIINELESMKADVSDSSVSIMDDRIDYWHRVEKEMENIARRT